MRVKVVDSHPGAAVAITAQQSGLPTQRSICWRFGNASNVVAPQGAETKVVDSHREAAVVITAQQSGLPLAALHPLALWKRQPYRRHRKMRKRKSLTATRSSRHFIVSGFSPKGPNPYNVRPSCIVTNHDPSLHLSTQHNTAPGGLVKQKAEVWLPRPPRHATARRRSVNHSDRQKRSTFWPQVSATTP